MKKVLKLLIFLFVFLNLIFLGFLNYSDDAMFERVSNTTVTRIIDGDTIDTSMGEVRLLGINTPEEGRAGYEEAGEFISFLEGEQVTLIGTVRDKDRFGRLLRYVFFEGRNMNMEILENGFAHTYIFDEDEYKEDLLEAEQKAIGREIGIWERSMDECSSCINLIEINNSEPYEYVLLGNRCDFSCDLARWSVKDESSSDSNFKKVDFILDSGGQKKITYKNDTWSEHDTLFLRDREEKLVLWHRY